MWRFRIVRVRRRWYRTRTKSSTSKKEFIEKKEIARNLVLQKLETWQKYYLENFNIGLNFNRVAIKNTTTRWGSCSSKKNLNFSYKIILLSEPEQDYLIVHELCHLAEMNHGENFWKLVSLAIPNFKNVRAKMKKFKLS